LKAKTKVLASSLSFGEGWGEVTEISEVIKCKSLPKTEIKPFLAETSFSLVELRLKGKTQGFFTF
jgi:hypothetical protein